MRPRVHARIVETGIVGSSKLATADRTSGYGESSSNLFSKSVKNKQLGLVDNAYPRQTQSHSLDRIVQIGRFLDPYT